MAEKILRIFDMQFQVFGGVLITQFHRLGFRLSDLHDAVVAPRQGSDLAGWQHRQLLLNFTDCLARESLTQTDEADAAIGIVFGLSQ